MSEAGPDPGRSERRKTRRTSLRLPADIVFASLVPWGRLPYWRWRSMFRAAVAAGHRVLWVDQFCSYGAGTEVLRNPSRLWPRLEERDPGIFVLSSPLRAPGETGPAGRLLTGMAVRQVRSAVAKLGMNSPLLWIAGPPGRALIGNLGESWSLYDCSDDLTRLSVAPTLLVEERKTLDQADLVIACSQALMESKRGCRSALFWVPNGVDADHFDPARLPADVPSRLRGLRAPIIGYHGAVYNRIDWDLVRFACKAQPDWSFVFMGPVHEAPPAEVAVLPNLHLVGEVPFEELPHLYRGCAACWVPHKVNDLTERQSSLKIYEYLAAGRPTVATRLPLAPDLAGMIGTGSSHQQIVDALRTALATDSPKRASERVKVARANSWTTRLAAYGDALTTVAAGTDAA